MSDDTDLNPQEPGAQPQADPMADLAQQTVATIVGELDALTTEQLAALYGIEKSGDGRKGVLAAIEQAQAERAEVEPPPPAKVPNVTGDATRYARLRAAEIDQARSEERRVGKEGVSTCRSRWPPHH